MEHRPKIKRKTLEKEEEEDLKVVCKKNFELMHQGSFSVCKGGPRLRVHPTTGVHEFQVDAAACDELLQLVCDQEAPMAYLWQPGEEKGTISIEKTSCQNIRNVTTAPKSDSKSAQQNEFKIELVRQWRETHYRVLAHLYQCFEVRYSSIIGLEKTEKFCFPAVNLDMLPRNFVFDAAQPTPSGENSSEGADEHEEEDREEEDSEDEVVEVRAPKGQNVKKGQKDLKAQKGVKAVKEVKVKEEKETHGHPPW